MSFRPILFIFLSGLSGKQMKRLTDPKSSALGERLVGNVSGALQFPLQDKLTAMQTSVMTGVWPDQHGILLPEIRDAETLDFRRVSGRDRRYPAFWERLALEGRSVVSVGWPYALPCEPLGNMQVLDATFGSAEITLPSAVFPDTASGERARDLFEAWLRTDELPLEVLQTLVPRIGDIYNRQDARFGQLASALAENISRHAAFLEMTEDPDWQLATLHLDLLAQLSSLAEKSKGDAIFDDLETKGIDVIAEMISAIIAQVPAETNFILAGIPNRLGSAGRVLFHGPGFSDSSSTCGASALDLAPTIWALAGFTELKYPGRVLMEILQTETLAGSRYFRARWQQSTGREPIAAERACRDRLYSPGLNPRSLYTSVELHAWQADWNLTLFRSFVGHCAYLEALPIVEHLIRYLPDQVDYIKVLSEILLRAGLYEESLEVAWDAAEISPTDDPDPQLLAASALALMGKHEEARALLTEVNQLISKVTDKQRLLQIYEYFEEWDTVLALAQQFSSSLPLDRRCHSEALAHLALGHFDEARDLALESVAANYANPYAHETLGKALWKLNVRSTAMSAFSTCACLAPNRAWPFHNLVQYGKQARCALGDIEHWQLQEAFGRQYEQKLIDDYRQEVAQFRAPSEKTIPILAPLNSTVESKPMTIAGVIGLSGAGQEELIRRLQAREYQFAQSTGEEFWPSLVGATPEPLQFDNSRLYDFPNGIVQRLPGMHTYFLIICQLTDAQITEAWMQEELPEELSRLDRDELVRLLLRQQYLMNQDINASPNIRSLSISASELESGDELPAALEAFLSEAQRQSR